MNILEELKALPHGAERRTVEWDALRLYFSGRTDAERWDDFDAWLLAWHLSHEIKKHDIGKHGTYTKEYVFFSIVIALLASVFYGTVYSQVSKAITEISTAIERAVPRE